MNFEKGFPMHVILSKLLKTFLSLSLITILSVSASADPLERGIQGAIGGAIIGGVLKGKGGIGKGAAVGATVGILGGALERRQKRSFEYDHRPVVHYHPSNHRYRYTPAGSPLVEDIQYELNRLGYRPGPIDGVFGRRTAYAIGAYQREHDLLVTKRPSKALLRHIYRNGG